MLEDIVTHHNADIWYRGLRKHLNDHVLRPMLAAHIDHCFAHGLLPLPPLDLTPGARWSRQEAWYLGDLS